METPLLFLIVGLTGIICALAGFWFYRASRESKQSVTPPPLARRAARNEAWDSAVRAARNRNW